MKQKAATLWLVVVTVSLALDVAMRLSRREAAAQQPELRVEPQPAVRIIQIAGALTDGAFCSKRFLRRLWSDGVIEEKRRSLLGADPQWQGWVVVPEVPAP